MRASKLLAAGIALFATAWQARIVHADVSPDEVTVVARVGARTITAADVSRRIAQLPPFQLRAFGKTPDEVRRNFVDKVMVREALLAQGAVDAKLADRDEVAERIRGVLRNAMLARVRAEAGSAAPVSDAEIKQYYDANPAKYHAPERVQIWRIQVAKREEAQAVLAELKKDPTPKRWNELAREQSIDRATNLRGGNLGFVAPDGTTSEAGLKVDAALLAAVSEAKDAELLPAPRQGRRSLVGALAPPIDEARQPRARNGSPADPPDPGARARRDQGARPRGAAPHRLRDRPQPRRGRHARGLLDRRSPAGAPPRTMQARKPLNAQPIPAPGTLR